MCKKSIRSILLISLIVVLIITIILLGFAIKYIDASIWEFETDFKKYQSQFELIKDYIIENVPQDTMLYIKRNSEHYFDLYNPYTGEYLNCPQAVHDALKTIEGPEHIATIHHKDNKIIFQTEVYYAIVYCEEGSPKDIWPNRPSKWIFSKRAAKDWYHISYHKFF